jgi:GMP synthase (glutamine-hydrolysing)
MDLHGVQLHPEVDLNPKGKLMLHNSLLGIAALAGNYTRRDRESQCMQYIRNTVSDKKVLLGSEVLDSVRSFLTEIYK